MQQQNEVVRRTLDGRGESEAVDEDEDLHIAPTTGLAGAPGKRRDGWTEREDTIIINGKTLGDTWHEISSKLPGRTFLSVQSRWTRTLRQSAAGLAALQQQNEVVRRTLEIEAHEVAEMDAIQRQEHVLRLERLRRRPSAEFEGPTADGEARATAFFNSGPILDWPFEAVFLVALTLPQVGPKLVGFPEAVKRAEDAGYSTATLDPRVRERLDAIRAVLEPAYLASAEAAREGKMSLSYPVAAQTAAEREQCCLTRLIQGMVLLYSPLFRRRADRPRELVAVFRHIEPYLFAEPKALEPLGELLSGKFHSDQHVKTRGIRRDLDQPLGGYLEYTSQGPFQQSSMNVMFDGQNFCLRAWEDEVGRTRIMSDGGELAQALAEQFDVRPDEPVDLLSGALFVECVDVRRVDAESVAWLLKVLQVPTLRRRITTYPRKKTTGTPEQQRVRAQEEAEDMMDFHYVEGDAYKGSVLNVAAGQPANGTPVYCLDAVIYGDVRTTNKDHFRR